MSLRRQGASYLAVLLAAACGGSDDAPPPPPQPPQPLPTLGVVRVFPALTFSQPIAFLQAPGDASRWFVVEKGGIVRVFANDPQVTTSAIFVNISARVVNRSEMGLLGMAFHPDFPATPRVYLGYIHQAAVLVARISEFTLGVNGNLDPNTERVLITIDQPVTNGQPEPNHKGGNLAFGRDGFLYIGTGDGGGGNDQHPPIGNGQRMTILHGKMLRIDVNSGSPYGIPGDNPFGSNPRCNVNGTGSANCPEIYASGFRNPWRWSFDRANGDLWVADVGQGALEEIDRVIRGGNYGWRCFEGTQATTNLPCGSEAPLLPPVAEYGRNEGQSVTGGYVYRGNAIPGLQGHYVFGDFVSGRLWHIAGDTAPTLVVTGGVETGLNIASFGEDTAGELYIVDLGGELYRVIAN